MKIGSIYEDIWAVKLGVLPDLQARLKAHLGGDKIDWKAINADFDAKIAIKAQNGAASYQVIDNTAIIDISGPMMKNMDIFAWLFGGCSTQQIAAQVIDAANNNQIGSIVLRMDTPGGMVSGLSTLTDAIVFAKSDKNKKVITAIDSMMASAGVWAGTFADKVYATSSTAMIGSIGVVTSHTDISGAEAQAGMVTTEVAYPAGKRVASEYAPLSDAGKNSLMENVKNIYNLFAGDVAKNRNMSVEDITNLDGKMMLAAEAQTCGLIDGIMSMQDILKSLQGGVSAVAGGVPKTVAIDNKNKLGEQTEMETLAELKAQNPALYIQAIAEGQKAEQARISAIQSLPGAHLHKDLIAQAITDPTKTKEDVLYAMAAANDLLISNSQKALEEARKPVEATSISGDGAVAITGGAPTYASEEEEAKAIFAKNEKIKADFAGSVEACLAYVRVHGIKAIKEDN